MLMHQGQNIESTWYTKPSNTGVTLNFHAIAPLSYKRSVVRSFTHRIWNSCSTYEHFHNSLSNAKYILEDNQYPVRFYEPIIHATMEKIVPKKKNEVKLVFD